jgi:hypothetical protein
VTAGYAVFLGCGLTQSRDCRLRRLPNPLDLPKAFQKQTSFAFGFFNAHPLNQASLFRSFALKKPLTL